jgi:hypothetical protein
MINYTVAHPSLLPWVRARFSPLQHIYIYIYTHIITRAWVFLCIGLYVFFRLPVVCIPSAQSTRQNTPTARRPLTAHHVPGTTATAFSTRQWAKKKKNKQIDKKHYGRAACGRVLVFRGIHECDGCTTASSRCPIDIRNRFSNLVGRRNRRS